MHSPVNNIICITSVRYRYQDNTSAAGSWIYRIMDCDSNDKRDMLCQCFVEVVTESESKSQGVSRLVSSHSLDIDVANSTNLTSHPFIYLVIISCDLTSFYHIASCSYLSTAAKYLRYVPLCFSSSPGTRCWLRCFLLGRLRHRLFDGPSLLIN